MARAPKTPRHLYPVLLVIGMGIAYGSLLVNQELGGVTLALASMLSPTGAKATIMGFRIKHWLVGIVVGIIGILAYFTEEKHSTIKMVGVLMAGASILLVLDEYEAVINTIITGQYP